VRHSAGTERHDGGVAGKGSRTSGNVPPMGVRCTPERVGRDKMWPIEAVRAAARASPAASSVTAVLGVLSVLLVLERRRRARLP
jgi:hypothetical protein